MRTAATLVFAAVPSVLLYGREKEESPPAAAPAGPTVTAADYIGTYVASNGGSSSQYVLTGTMVNENTLRFSSTWDSYTSTEDYTATVSGNNLTFTEESYWVQRIGTTGGHTETVEGTGIRNGNAMQLNLTVKAFYPPEMGGGVFVTENLVVVANR